MILVTGATGFLGSVLTRQLLEQGLQVRAIKRENSLIPDFLQDQPKLEWLNGDILDIFSLEDALEGVEKVYHTAAVISFHPADKQQMMAVNVEGTANLVNLCLQAGNIRLVHASSISALGEAKNSQLVTETDIWDAANKPSAYSLSKNLSEMEVWRGMAEGLDAVIVNPSVILGKESGWKGSGSLFHVVKKGMSFYPGGSLGLVGVNDVAAAMRMLMDSNISGERFILNAENWSYRDLFTEIALNFGLKAPEKQLKDWQLRLAGTVAEWLTKLSGKPLGLTRSTARSAVKRTGFSNEKISKTIAIQFTPIRQIITETCAALK